MNAPICIHYEVKSIVHSEVLKFFSAFKIFLGNSFVDISFTQCFVHPYKVHNSVDFSKFTKLPDHHHSQL